MKQNQTIVNEKENLSINNLIKKLMSKLKGDIHLAELLKGSAIAFLLRLIGMFLGYLVTLMIARQYGAEGSGILALTLTYVSIATILAKVGLDISAMKIIARLQHTNDTGSIKALYYKTLKIILFFSLLISVLFLFLSDISAQHLFKKDYLSTVFQLAVLMIIPMALIHFHAESLRGYKKIAHYFFINSICVSAISILLISLDFKTICSDYVYIDIYIIAQFTTALLAIIFWLKESRMLKINSIDPTHPKTDAISTKSLLKTSFPIMISGSIALIMGWMDIIMLGVFKTEADVGVYSIALKLATLTSIALIAVNSIVAPKISQMYSENDLHNLQKTIQQSTKMIFIVSLPLLLIYFIFPTEMMSIFGESFKVGSAALIILSVGQFVNAMSGPVGQVLNMTDREHVLRNTAIIAVLINFTLNYILIPLYGIDGAAVSTAITGIIWNLLCVVYIYKKMEILVIYLPFISTQFKNKEYLT